MMNDSLVDLVGGELFGRPARLRVALWVSSQNQRFWQQLVADGARVRPQYVRAELNHLTRLGMIEPADTPEDAVDRRNFFRRCDTHPLWGVIEAAAGALEALDSDGTTVTTPLRSV